MERYRGFGWGSENFQWGHCGNIFWTKCFNFENSSTNSDNGATGPKVCSRWHPSIGGRIKLVKNIKDDLNKRFETTTKNEMISQAVILDSRFKKARIRLWRWLQISVWLSQIGDQQEVKPIGEECSFGKSLMNLSARYNSNKMSVVSSWTNTVQSPSYPEPTIR